MPAPSTGSKTSDHSIIGGNPRHQTVLAHLRGHTRKIIHTQYELTCDHAQPDVRADKPKRMARTNAVFKLKRIPRTQSRSRTDGRTDGRFSPPPVRAAKRATFLFARPCKGKGVNTWLRQPRSYLGGSDFYSPANKGFIKAAG